MEGGDACRPLSGVPWRDELLSFPVLSRTQTEAAGRGVTLVTSKEGLRNLLHEGGGHHQRTP